MASKWRRISKTIQRKRVFEEEQLERSSLKRCLSDWDLAGLGLGSILGVGVYVLTGSVALRFAGPSIILSFLIAAVASMFAGLCYAEFGARVPKTGSAYIYTYVAVGELLGFLVGWNMLLEATFGAASVARGFSAYLDSMSGGAMSAWYQAAMPLPAGCLSPYFDLFAFSFILLLGLLLAAGVRESANFMNILTIINLSVILFIVIVGSFKAQPSNWSIPPEEVPEGFGVGGFFPYGVWGTLQGAGLCFYGFVGFEAISATGEEVHEPRRSIPQSIVIVLCIVFLVYASMSTVVTMMVPYYLLDRVAAVATAFIYVHWDWARWVVSVGACVGISASAYGSLYPLIRLMYAMASDGLLLHWFAKVWSIRQTPLVATVVAASIISVMAATVELEQLVLMMCIGTLISYTFVAACVVILRYRTKYVPEMRLSFVLQLLGRGHRQPTKFTSRIALFSLILYVAVCITSALVGANAPRPLVPVACLHCAALVLLLVIALQPQATVQATFKTPFVPLIPCLSIYVNIHLMILVSMQTWIRVIVWILIGIPVYAICLYCYNRPETPTCNKETGHNIDTEKNGKVPVQIVVEAPTPPDTLKRTNEFNHFKDNKLLNHENITDQIQPVNQVQPINQRSITPFIVDEIIVQQAAVIENNEEKEAKIIDLLDQVLQAEEDNYIEEISLKEEEIPSLEQEIMVPLENIEETVTLPHRKSLSELSDAESEASLTNQDTKYSVIAQVHREDLPKVKEEEEKQDEKNNNLIDQGNNFNESTDNASNDASNQNITEHQDVTAFDDNDSNSQSDEESGYSDTLDRNALNDSVEDNVEISRIPTPPPLDEKFFNSPFFIKKSYSIPSRPTKLKLLQKEDQEEHKPRESIQSNASGQSQDDGNIVFGSNRQIKFMNKLNNIFQNKIIPDTELRDEQRKRSNSTGDVTETVDSPQLMKERPSIFFDLKRELVNMHSFPKLRPLNNEEVEHKKQWKSDNDEPSEDSSMSRENLKSKLEIIFASGGPKLLKPRLMKSNPPTPEEFYHTDTSSNESIAKLPKIEKNDTLKRQKDKFGAVLNSFRLSLNKDDAV